MSLPTPYAASYIAGHQSGVNHHQTSAEEEGNSAASGANQNVTMVEIKKENFAHIIEFREVPAFYRTDPAAFTKLVQMFTGGQALP